MAEQTIKENSNIEDYFQEQFALERANAIRRKQLEDQTESDLKKQGFQVIRVPGRFNYSAGNPAMNLFNMVTAIAPDGKKIVVLLGCIHEDYKKQFEQILREHSSHEIDMVYFLDPQASRETLICSGGISCRTKTIGHLPHEKKGT